MSDRKSKDSGTLYAKHSNVPAQRRSNLGSSLRESFLQASEDEKVFFKNLDYDNATAILMTGKPIVARQNIYSDYVSVLALKEKADEKFYGLLLTLSLQELDDRIAQAFEAIDEAINGLDNLVRLADIEIERIHQRLQDMTARHNKLLDAIETKDFSKDEQGQFENESIAKTLRLYIQRTGKIIPDDILPNELIEILNTQTQFEKSIIIPELEADLIRLSEFRDKTDHQKEKIAYEKDTIDEKLQTIDADTALSNEQKRERKIEALKKASNTALDAQAVMNQADQEYINIIADIQKSDLDQIHQNLEQNNRHETKAYFNKVQNADLSHVKPFKL